jgi:hypothetical protein
MILSLLSENSRLHALPLYFSASLYSDATSAADERFERIGEDPAVSGNFVGWPEGNLIEIMQPITS